MKIKNIIAPNMTEALAQIKAELGEDAVIISSENAADGSVMVTAALEDDFDISFDEQDEANIVEAQNVFDERYLRECLEYHAVVQNVGEKVMALARQISREQNLSDNKKILEKVFDKLYRYDDILDLNQPVKLFMGTPGPASQQLLQRRQLRLNLKRFRLALSARIISAPVPISSLRLLPRFWNLIFIFAKMSAAYFSRLMKLKSAML